jgi:hypothetical protein
MLSPRYSNGIKMRPKGWQNAPTLDRQEANLHRGMALSPPRGA